LQEICHEPIIEQMCLIFKLFSSFLSDVDKLVRMNPT
jgi:hypothetical protein